MIRETYKGRKLTARSEKSRGIVVVTCGGEPVDWPATRDLQAALDSMKPTIDLVDQDPSVDGSRWGAYLYAPGTYEMCPEGIHPQDIGGQCRHFTCEAQRKAAQS